MEKINTDYRRQEPLMGSCRRQTWNITSKMCQQWPSSFKNIPEEGFRAYYMDCFLHKIVQTIYLKQLFSKWLQRLCSNHFNVAMATHFDVMYTQFKPNVLKQQLWICFARTYQRNTRSKLSRLALNHCSFSLKRFYFIVRLVCKVKIVPPIFYTTKQPKANQILVTIIIIYY